MAKTERKCLVEGCDNKHYAKGFCQQHYNKYRGKEKRKHDPLKKVFLPDGNRIYKQKYNPMYIEDDYAVMIVANNQGEEFKVLIDIEDMIKIVPHLWRINPDGYIITHIEGTTVLLHRYLLMLYEGTLGDHKNGDKLDNRKHNLRGCNHQENCRNRRIMKNNTSGVVGVHWIDKSKKWAARIGVDNKIINLGNYKDFTEAVKARQAAEIKYFGEFRRVTPAELQQQN